MGRKVAKIPAENATIRRELLMIAEGNAQMQAALMEMCAASILWWINNFVWVVHATDIDEHGIESASRTPHIPFVTWPVQDSAIGLLQECIEGGHDAVVDKSRFMAGTQIGLMLATWHWLFRPGSHMLLVSRKEEMVDAGGDPDTLFGKIDYMLMHLPDWMLPAPRESLLRGGRNRRHLQLVNPRIGCTIIGESTTAHIGAGRRRKFVFYDEMARMADASEGWRAGADVTTCRIANSTPWGPGTEFTRQRNRAAATGTPRLVELLYFNHPDKGRGREWRINEGEIICLPIGGGYWDTPWLRDQVKRRGDAQDIAENVFAEHIASGLQFFPPEMVSRHIAANVSPPVRCELNADGTGFDSDAPQGRWYVWGARDRYGGLLRNTDYVGFADLGGGVGSSNTVLAVMDCRTGDIVAEYVDPFTNSVDLAEEVALAGNGVFKGLRGPMFVGWEANGPGESWYAELERLGYRRMYRQRRIGTKAERRTRAYGWRSTRQRKRVLLAGLASAMQRGEVSIKSEPGLLEMAEYVFYDNGEIGPGSHRDMTTGAREAHGDRVIAYAGCVMMRQESRGDMEPWAPGTMGHLIGLNRKDIFDESDFGIARRAV